MLKVGDYHEMASVPKSFPTCFDYSNQVEADNIEASASSVYLSFQIILSSLALVLFSRSL